MLGWSPVINGLQIGELVELRTPSRSQDDGSADEASRVCYGQITAYAPDSDLFSVALVDTGAVRQVEPAAVAPATPPFGHAPGFDAIVGPRTGRGVLGETLSCCLMEKGFCVLRVIPDQMDLSRCFELMKGYESSGTLGRLASEVEEGYLGEGGRAKVMWLDPEDAALPTDSPLKRIDASITSIAEVLQAYAEDAMGSPLEERTPALACMSMTDADELEFESPVADEQVIQEYYSTWCRSVLRIAYVAGPSDGRASLRLKEASPIGGLDARVEIVGLPGTVLVTREDTYDLTVDAEPEGEVCWLQSFLMKQAPQWTLGEIDGDLDVFEQKRGGPPPPSESAGNRVAVVAMSIQACGKMTDHHKEWNCYIAGTDAQLEMPFTRFDYTPYYNDDVELPRGTYVKHFSVQEGIEMFDNKTFEVSNLEAASMDPLCRQVLEVGCLSIFQIGITKKFCNTNPIHASVSVGCDKQEWLNMSDVPQSVGTNNQLAICANRFNYIFNLKGGSYVMDTACSSSLCAAHLGKVNLLERRWDPLEWHLGLGAGVTLTVFCFFGNCAAHMLSPSGRCLTFNATANGYNRGDGTSAMVIKAGSRDGERIAYFRGSQIGQDGRSASMAAPNGPAQEKCIWGAIREALMQPPESTVWECHGTGTSLGDPIEVGAVRKVQIKMPRPEPLMIATSKSNCGHLEGSAAQLAMNKCIMQVVMLVCCPTQHLKTLNPHLDHTTFNAIFISEHNPYRYKRGHCQVSSFGVGGTNGHAIFWGEAELKPIDLRSVFLRKLMKGAPILRDGSGPKDWEFSGMAYDALPGDKYRVTCTLDPLTQEESFTYDKSLAAEDIVEFYCLTGSHNDWGQDRMLEGDAPGLFYQEVTVPDSGRLEFRILADGEEDRMIGPEATTTRKTLKICGPDADQRTSWMVVAAPGSVMVVEFLAPTSPALGGARTITWFPLQEE